MEHSELRNAFSYHSPNDQQIIHYQEIRSKARDLAEYIHTQVPQSREQALAITKLREAVMWANAGIACNS